MTGSWFLFLFIPLVWFAFFLFFSILLVVPVYTFPTSWASLGWSLCRAFVSYRVYTLFD